MGVEKKKMCVVEILTFLCVLCNKFGTVKEQHELLFHTHGNSQLDKTKHKYCKVR